jgi:hypothetical protein
VPINLTAVNWTMSGLGGVLDSRNPTGTQPNRSPVIATIPSQTRDAGSTFSIAGYGSDLDGDALTWTRTGGTAPVGVTVSPQGEVAIFADAIGGDYTVIVQASDGRGGTASATFALTLRASGSSSLRPIPAALAGARLLRITDARLG